MSTLARRAGRILREALLTVAALGGAACIVLVVLAFTGGYSLVMFKTGSMSPTIPAGSVALVQQIPASEIAVGDVVTVERSDALPITHRVTTIADGASDDQKVITMRGDANETEDPLPYTIDEVRIVRGSVPHLAHVIVWFGNPIVLGGITIFAAILVTWAFWPREPRVRTLHGTRVGAPHGEATTGDQDPAPPQTRREGRSASLLTVGILLGAAAAAGLTAAPSEASTSILTMTSDLDGSGPHRLDASEPFPWHVDIDATAAPSDGDLAVDLSGTGDPGFMISVEVRACAVPWQSGTCAKDEQTLRARAPIVLDGTWSDLLRSGTPAVTHLRLSLTAEAPDDASAGGSLTVRATAQGESADETINGTGELPDTGGVSWGLVAAPAAVLVGIGIAMIAGARRRQAPSRGCRR
jgi:signal peptidase